MKKRSQTSLFRVQKVTRNLIGFGIENELKNDPQKSTMDRYLEPWGPPRGPPRDPGLEIDVSEGGEMREAPYIYIYIYIY